MQIAVNTTGTTSTENEATTSEENQADRSCMIDYRDTERVTGGNERAPEKEENGSQELTKEEIEAFIRSEQVAASEGNNADMNSKYSPQIGMEFIDKNCWVYWAHV